MMEFLFIWLLAFIFDVTLGDPPNFLHPVAGMGRAISFLEKGGHQKSHRWQFLYGAGMTVLLVALFAVPAYYLLSYLKDISPVAYVLVAALLLKLGFSFRGLRQAAVKIKRLLRENKADTARFELRALVSRETQNLAEPQMVSAAVESVAEGTCDSVVAPLFYFLLFGVPGVVGYRLVNTMDAMIGYHGRYEYLGKFASRLDDILNYVPARLSALLLVLAAFIVKRSGSKAWRVAFSEHVKTASPNAGWPMAAMAGALDVRLEKVGHYQLGAPNAALPPGKIDEAVKLLQVAGLIWFGIGLTAGVCYYVITT